MAKQIKVIKCPQCGSTEKSEFKPDFYRCNNCQTEYFLDDNDVTINYNHNYNHNNHSTFNAEQNKKVIKVIGIVFGCLILFGILINLFTAIFSSKDDTVSSAYSVGTAEEEDKSYSASRYAPRAFLDAKLNTPVFMVLESRNYRGNSQEVNDGLYLCFYDPLGKKLLAEEKIGDKDLSGSDVNTRVFSDGNIYVNVDKTALYVLDKAKLKLVEVGKKFYTAKQELQVGVATADFTYEDNGDGLVILTNDGKKFYYYPLIQKLYTEDQYYDARRGFNNLLPGAKDKVLHIFTEKSSDYPEDKIMLLKLTYRDNGAGPKDIVNNISWRKDYGGSGIFTERDPYKKVLFDAYMKASERVLNWKDLTPERLYFSPDVLLDDNEMLIVTFKANANPNSNYKIQKLNTTTGAAEWTADVEKDKMLRSMIKYKEGLMAISNSDEVLLYDNKGKLTGNFKLD